MFTLREPIEGGKVALRNNILSRSASKTEDIIPSRIFRIATSFWLAEGELKDERLISSVLRTNALRGRVRHAGECGVEGCLCGNAVPRQIALSS